MPNNSRPIIKIQAILTKKNYKTAPKYSPLSPTPSQALPSASHTSQKKRRVGIIT